MTPRKLTRIMRSIALLTSVLFCSVLFEVYKSCTVYTSYFTLIVRHSLFASHPKLCPPLLSYLILPSLEGFCAGVFGAAINTPGDTIRTVVQKRVLGSLPGKIPYIPYNIIWPSFPHTSHTSQQQFSWDLLGEYTMPIHCTALQTSSHHITYMALIISS